MIMTLEQKIDGTDERECALSEANSPHLEHAGTRTHRTHHTMSKRSVYRRGIGKNAYGIVRKKLQATRHSNYQTPKPTANKIRFSGIDNIGTKEWRDQAGKDLKTVFRKTYSKISPPTKIKIPGHWCASCELPE